MPARIFISCGQHDKRERDAAVMVQRELQSMKYETYVATQVQTIGDVNAEIVAELKQSDYFLFINFKRERIIRKTGNLLHRGSLHANQELAIAYALGFPPNNMILINEKNVEKDGFTKTMVSNVRPFETIPKLLFRLRQAIKKAGWNTGFTRNLFAKDVRLSHKFPFEDHVEKWENETGKEAGSETKNIILTLGNRRRDVGAMWTIVLFKGLEIDEVGIRKLVNEIGDTKSLQVTSTSRSYTQHILPENTGDFDLLAFNVEKPTELFLVSENDSSPRCPVIAGAGNYIAVFLAYSAGFPPLDIRIEVTIAAGQEPNARILR